MADPLATALRARWIFRDAAPPLEHATLEIHAGRITAIHDRDTPHALDLGNVALIPGLVNAHTHFEFGDLTAPLTPPTPFTAWLQALLAHRRQHPVDVPRAIHQAAIESTAAGITLVGDIATPGWTADALPPDGPAVVAFCELLGLRSDQRADQLARAANHLAGAPTIPTRGAPIPPPPAATPAASGRVIRGLSPHAPYSVHPDLFRDAVQLAVQAAAPVAVHLAETPSELDLLRDGRGEFVDFLERLGVWQPQAIPRGSRPLDYLRMLQPVASGLVVHGNYLDDEELTYLAGQPQLTVVYCPRTHAYFQHAPHRWQEMLARGIRVALGTDSRASNPDLSLWSELRFLRHAFPHFPPDQLLPLGTTAGARALGLPADSTGLAAGRPATFTTIALPAADSTDPWSLLFHPQSHPIAPPHLVTPPK